MKLLTIFFILSSLTIRVGTYNLWRSDLGKGDYRWEVRKDRLAKSIVENNFDIFAAEEVDTTMFRELPGTVKRNGGRYTWFTFSPYNPEGKGAIKAQALVFKTSRFKMLENHHFWFSETPDKMSSGWDEMKFKRGGCCFILKDKKTKQRIFVMVSHMPLAKTANYEAAKIILDKARQFNPENLPAFFIGDLNTTPGTSSSELLRTYWSDPFFADIVHVGSKGTFNSHNIDKDMDKAGRIDYVYYRGEVTK